MPGLVERPHILIHGKGMNAAGTGDAELAQPANAPQWMLYCEAVTFIVAVTGVTGSPSAWSLGCKFQLIHPDAYDTVNDYSLATEYWSDLTVAKLDMIDEGVGWYGPNKTPPLGGAAGIIADQTDTISTTAPVIVSRTIRPGARQARIVFSPAFTGGTSPTITTQVVAIPKV